MSKEDDQYPEKLLTIGNPFVNSTIDQHPQPEDRADKQKADKA